MRARVFPATLTPDTAGTAFARLVAEAGDLALRTLRALSDGGADLDTTAEAARTAAALVDSLALAVDAEGATAARRCARDAAVRRLDAQVAELVRRDQERQEPAPPPRVEAAANAPNGEQKRYAHACVTLHAAQVRVAELEALHEAQGAELADARREADQLRARLCRVHETQ